MKMFLSLTLFVMSTIVFASGGYKVITSHPMEIYDSGSIEEAMNFSQQWKEKVLLKNQNILDVEYLLNKESDRRYELLVIYSYQDKDSALLANQQMGILIDKAWPDKSERQAFFTKLQSYVVQEEKVTRSYDVIVNH